MLREQLERLTTKRLLAYRNKLLQTTETGDWIDYPNSCVKQLGGKQSTAWQAEYQIVKDILASREHIDKPNQDRYRNKE